MFTEQMSPFFHSNRRDGLLFSLVLLFCAVLLVTVLLLFQKAAINNTFISKASSCDFYVVKLIIIVRP